EVKANFTHIEWSFVHRKCGYFKAFANPPFALITDFEVTSGLNPMATDAKHKAAFLERHGMQRNPSRNSLSCGKGPVELVHMPRWIAAAAFRAESLVVVDRDAMGPEQLSSNPRQTLAEYKVPDNLTF